MTSTLRAKIDRDPMWMQARHPWNISIRYPAPNDNVVRIGCEATHTDAVNAAHRMLRDLDRELMAEVHESRSTRYAARVEKIAAEALEAHPPLAPVFPMISTAAQHLRSAPDAGRCGGCRDLGPHRNVPGCEFYDQDKTTMEATA